VVELFEASALGMMEDVDGIGLVGPVGRVVVAAVVGWGWGRCHGDPRATGLPRDDRNRP
jgi:hypothetical protein